MDIWGVSAKALANAIDKTKDFRRKVELIEAFLLNHLLTPNPSVIDLSLKEAYASKGFIEVAQLSKKVSLSQAQFSKTIQ